MNGSCLCGAVRFEATDDAEGFSICHCSQCRKQSGHLWASAHAPMSEIRIDGEVKWFEASAKAKRGFCPVCGSFLFWKAYDEDSMSFSLGALEAPTGITLKRHIFASDKGDYYEIADGLPQRP